MKVLFFYQFRKFLGVEVAAFVFKCDPCGKEIRLISAKMLKGVLSTHCYKCNLTRKFTFVREGNMGSDWVSKINL